MRRSGPLLLGVAFERRPFAHGMRRSGRSSRRSHQVVTRGIRTEAFEVEAFEEAFALTEAFEVP